MDACYPRSSHTPQAIWAHSACQILKASAYKISNYLLGGIFRNILFTLPPQPTSTNQACEDFLNPSFEINQESVSRSSILTKFQIRTEEIELRINNTQFFIQARIYEARGTYAATHTSIRVGGKDETLEASDIRIYPLLKAYLKTKEIQEQGLRIIQFSLHGHRFGRDKEPWQPKDASEIGNLFFAFLQYMQKIYPIDSLICHSLGSIVMESLDRTKHQLPNLLILDRPFASVWKIGRRLYHPVVAYVIYTGARLAGWAAAPEISLKKYFAQSAHAQTLPALSNRRVILIEAKDDYYFGGPGAFADSFIEALSHRGIETYRKSFEPNTIAFHNRAHHALALDKLKNGRTADKDGIMPLKAYESAASGLIKLLMYETKKKL